MSRTGETTVDDSGSVSIPAAVRELADIQSGDTVRWQVGDDGDVSIEIIQQETGVFEEFEPVSTGGPEFDSVEETDLSGDA